MTILKFYSILGGDQVFIKNVCKNHILDLCNVDL